MIEVQGTQIATDKILIKNVFAQDMWYSIPDYQRPYVWGEEQISTLLDDIAYAAKHTPDTQYFLGSVVLHCEDKKDKSTETNYVENSVLDGQQRLTTLYMLHAVIRDLTKNDKRKKSCSKVIFQEGDPDDGIPERMRLEFDIRDKVSEFVGKYIKPTGGTDKKEELEKIAKSSSNISIKNMAAALLLMRKWFVSEENTSIDVIFPFLRSKVILVYVASGELEDAFRLFTVLNDRGIKLRNSDILKALNLKEVTDETERGKYAKFWEELEGDLGEDFDKFLSYIRTILVKEKARNTLLKEFEENIYNRTTFNKSTRKKEYAAPLLKKGKDTFETIKKYKAHYDQIFSANNYKLKKNWAFDNLIAILNQTSPSEIWIPPLLAYREVFGDKKIFDFLVKLDNKFSADWICGATPTVRIDAMNKIIGAIEKANSDKDLSTDEKITSLFEDEVFNFKYEQLTDSLDSSYIYRKKYDRYLLRKADFLLDAPLYTELRNSYGTMSVEHILPRNPADNSQWMVDFEDEEVREAWTNAIGNLVLISRRKNSRQGRLDFSDKKKKYFSNSIETFPNSLKVMQGDSWDFEDLESHHTEILELFENHYSI